MSKRTDYNYTFEQAAAFVNHTTQPIFLTGNAGTGKTTFLRYISENCPKKKAIVAPTGVAAINAGGTTIHSLFWLPFGTYIENYDLPADGPDGTIYNKHRLLGNLRFRKEKRKLIRELELLIIDEVSMLRADMLDAMDAILKSVRRDARPFGGLQLLFIGDLYQLPPVVQAYEWAIMRSHYKSPFFFDAHCLKQLPLTCLELTKIYRQKDERFIEILNAIRNNTCSEELLERLNAHYQPGFTPTAQEPYITLCSHNRQADKINAERLAQLQAPTLTFEAAISGNFAENSFPADKDLEIKVGAQVMFIKNDKGEARRYYNGKIGIVKQADQQKVIVKLPEGGEDIEVTREKWENIQYKVDEKDNKIKEETLGTFSQFPLRLAWAVTIHKSQGLSFQRAIVDAGQSFAAGQVYVALSRLRSLGGLVLRSKIEKGAIHTDHSVQEFTKQILPEHAIDQALLSAKEVSLISSALQAFHWDETLKACQQFQRSMEEKNLPEKDTALAVIQEVASRTESHRTVSNRFRAQIQKLSERGNENSRTIHQRIAEAARWFSAELTGEILQTLNLHQDLWEIKPRTKKYIRELGELIAVYQRKLLQIQHAQQHSLSLQPDLLMTPSLASPETQDTAPQRKENSSAPGELSSREISYNFFEAGQSVEEIAKIRSISKDTVESHLIFYLGETLKPIDLYPEDLLKQVAAVIKANPELKNKEIKALAEPGISYNQIRVARIYMQQQAKVQPSNDNSLAQQGRLF